MKLKHEKTSKTVLLLLIGTVLLAAIVRLYGLDRQSLWYDEIAEMTAFQRQFLGDTSNSIPDTPPLHSVFIYVVTKLFPGSVFALRMVPLTFGVISIPLIFLLGRRLFNEKAGLISAYLLAISPLHIWYSQDARMYALQWMLSLLSLLYFVKALERPVTGNFAGYILSTAAGLYTNQFAFFLFAMQGLYVFMFFSKYRAQLLKWIYAFAAVVILYSPWIVYNLMFLMDRHAGSSKTIDLRAILYTLHVYCAGFSIGPSLRELHLDKSFRIVLPYLTEIVLILSTYLTLFALGIWSMRKDTGRLVLILLLFIVPVGGVFTLTKIMPNNVTYNIRYTGTALFAFLLFSAKGTDWLSSSKRSSLNKLLTISVLIVLTTFSARSYLNYQFDTKYHKEDIRSAVEYISEKRTDGDSILCIANAHLFNMYAANQFVCSELSPSTVNNKVELEQTLNIISKGKKRLWLVLSREWQVDRHNQTKKWLDKHYTEIKELHKGLNDIANVRIYCYDLVNAKNRHSNYISP